MLYIFYEYEMNINKPGELSVDWNNLHPKFSLVWKSTPKKSKKWI